MVFSYCHCGALSDVASGSYLCHRNDIIVLNHWCDHIYIFLFKGGLHRSRIDSIICGPAPGHHDGGGRPNVEIHIYRGGAIKGYLSDVRRSTLGSQKVNRKNRWRKGLSVGRAWEDTSWFRFYYISRSPAKNKKKSKIILIQLMRGVTWSRIGRPRLRQRQSMIRGGQRKCIIIRSLNKISWIW
jgi:hypothetical protein